MNFTIQAEINFHEQEKASVFLESDVSGDAERFAEITLASFYGVRMISNLGKSQVSDQIAAALQNSNALISSYLAVLDGVAPASGLRIIDYPGCPGRKRFCLKLHLWGSQAKFDVQQIGFGFLAKGIGYYGPASVLAVLARLCVKRRDERSFLSSLALSAQTCSLFHFQQRIALTSHAKLVFPVLLAGCKQYVPSIGLGT